MDQQEMINQLHQYINQDVADNVLWSNIQSALFMISLLSFMAWCIYNGIEQKRSRGRR